MADFDSQLPVRALATEFTTEVADSTGTTIDPVEEFAQGSTTSGQKGPLDQGAVTTAAPTYLDGTTSPLSLDTAGNLRVAATVTPSGTQDVNITEVGGNPVTTTVPVSGTVTVVQPTGTNLHAVIDNFPADADALAQGSTTAGQLGALVMGAVTTAAPSYTTGQTDPLSLTPAGALRTDSSATTQPVSGTVIANQGTSPWVVNQTQVSGTAVSVNTGNSDAGTQRVVLASDQPAVNVNVSDTTVELPQYNTVASVAANATSTQTYSPGSTVKLDGVDASASGQMKVEIQYGTTGAEATKAVFFVTKGNLNLTWRLPHPVSITNTMSVKVIRTNMDNQAMDVYSTIQVH